MLSTNEVILAAVFITVGAALAPLAAYFLQWIGPYLYGEEESSQDTKIIIKKGERTIEFSSSISEDQFDALIVQLQNLASQN